MSTISALREAASVAVVAAVAVCGCGLLPAPPSVAPTSLVAPTLLVAPSPPAPTTSPVASQAVASPTPYPVVSIAGVPLKSIALSAGSPQIHRLSGFGPRIVFDEIGYGGDAHQGQTVWLADLESETLTKLATSEGGDAAWMPVIHRSTVAWVEWHYADNKNFTGALTWRVRLHDLTTGVTRTIRSGVSPATGGPGGIPLLALTDQGLIVAFESPSRSQPERWEIDFLALPGGQLTRAIESNQWIYSLASSDRLTAFTAGTRNSVGDFIFNTTLMIAGASDKVAHKIASDSFEVAVDGDRVIWVDDRAASRAPSPAAVAPRIFAAGAPDFVPQPISPPPNRAPIVGSSWPAAGDGFVTWTDNQDAPPKFSDPNGDHLVLWSDARGATQLEPTAGMILSAVGDGWLAWYNDWQPTLYLYGLRLKDLPPAALR